MRAASGAPGPPGRGIAHGMERRVESALEGGLASRLGLSRYRIRQGHYLHAVGAGREGPLFVSFFPDAARDRAVRAVAGERLMRAAGVDTPEVLDSDLVGETDPSLAWIALRFHEGRRPRLSDRAVAHRALGQLARIHRVEREAALRTAVRGDVGALPVYGDFAGLGREVERLCDHFARAGVEIPSADVERVRDFLQAGVAAMLAFEPAPPIVLLHSDYQPANLLVTPDGRLLVVDLEGAAFGAFPLDVARAFFKFRYKVAARSLDRVGFAQMLEDPTLRSLQDSYLAEASEDVRKFWTAHGRTVLLFGYLLMVRRRAKAAYDGRRYGLLRRRRSLRQALRRWQRVVEHVDPHGR